MTVATTKVSNSTHHVFPAVRLGLAAEIVALGGELSRTQWLRREQIEAAQLRQLKTLLDFCATHSPFYGHHLEAAGVRPGDIRETVDLPAIPRLARQEIQAAGEDFYCRDVPPDQGKIGLTQTSGSTGEPVKVRKTGISNLFLHAYTLRNHYWHQMPFGARYTCIRANINEYAVHRNWGPPYVHLYRTGPAQMMPITMPLAEQSRLLAEFQPQTLLIYPNNLKGLLRLWKQEGFPLTSLERIKSIGETLTDEVRQGVAELNPGIAVIDGYSSEECGAIALQCPEGGYHAMSEALLVEVLHDDGTPCQPGQIGRVVVTDLQNQASPIIRYEIGDYAQVGTPCRCGRGLLKLERILGRQRNLVVKPNGDRHWPLVGFHDFGTIAPIRQYQMIQEDLAHITVRFVTDVALTDAQKAAFTRLVRRALGHDFELDIRDQRENLPMQPNGKFEEFISRVP